MATVTAVSTTRRLTPELERLSPFPFHASPDIPADVLTGEKVGKAGKTVWQ